MVDKRESLPNLRPARPVWLLYAAGIAAEIAFILGLTFVAYVLAVLAMAAWR